MFLRGLKGHAPLDVQPVAGIHCRLAEVRVKREHVGIVERPVDEHVADIRIGLHVARSGVKPDAVLDERPAEPGVEVTIHLDRIRRSHPARAKPVVEIVSSHRTVREAAEDDAAEGIASIARNEVRPHAAFGGLGGHRRGIDDDFLDGARVDDPQRLECLVRPSGGQTIQVLTVVGALASVDGENGGRVAAGTTDFLSAEARVIDRSESGRHAWDEHAEAGRKPAGGKRVGHLLIEHALLCGVLDIDDRRLTANGHGFLDGPDAQFGVDGCGERACELDPLATDRTEAAEGEYDAIEPWTEVFDAVLSAAVGHRRADLLDEHRAGRLNGHAGQHRARRVAHDAGYRGLCEHDGGKHDNEDEQSSRSQ